MIFSFSLPQQLLFFLTAAIVLFLPGLAWILWSYHNGRDWVERIADALGLSIALAAILGMLFFFAGLKFFWWILLILYLACFLAVLAAFLKKQVRIRLRDGWVLAGLLLVLAAMIIWRFYQARTLVFPAWVDSVHHVLVVQKILDAAGLPSTLAPELPIKLTYHYGFHIITAVWSAISGLQPVDAVLWLGQVLNALIALGIYRVAKQAWKDDRIAILAALLVAFVFNMPAYYLTWGRYTLITGLLCLLPAMAASIEVLQNHFRWELFIRLAVFTCGLALVHYMALLFLGLFVGCLIVEKLIKAAWTRKKPDPSERTARLIVLAAACMLGILGALPWLFRMLTDQGASAGLAVNLPQWSDFKNSLQYILYLLGPNFNYWIYALAMIGLMYACFRKKSSGLALWGFLLIALSLPWGLKLGPFRPDHMAIILFIPGSWFLAYGLVNLGDDLLGRFGKFLPNLTVALLAVGLLAWGAWHTRSILNSVTILADQGDRQAVEWLAANTPADARFFANTTGWQYATFRGVDGGYWITSMTGRFSLALPSLYAYGNGQQKADWKAWMSAASKIDACDEDFWALVQAADLDFIYLHDGKGALQPEALVNCPGVTPAYNQNHVWIYLIDRPAGAQK
jgi:hypothetical protein